MTTRRDRVQYAVDKERGVCRVNGICFEADANEERIDEVLSEVMQMEVLAPGLMTCEALGLYLMAPAYVQERMKSMEIGDSFIYQEVRITRWSNSTYNGKAIVEE